jgi:hypothetical protein
MEKRSHRHVRDLVAHAALRGLDANEIGCARISMMAGSKMLHSKGRIQMSETNDLQISHIRLATHGLKDHPRGVGIEIGPACGNRALGPV